MYELTLLDENRNRLTEVKSFDEAGEWLMQHYKAQGLEPRVSVSQFSHGGAQFGYASVQWHDEQWKSAAYSLVLTIQLDAYECRLKHLEAQWNEASTGRTPLGHLQPTKHHA